MGGQRATHVVLDEVVNFPVGDYTKDGISRQRDAEQRAANFDRAKLDSVDWMGPLPKSFKRVMIVGAWTFYATPNLQQACAYINGRYGVVVVNTQTWKTISTRPETQAAFIQHMTNGASGMKFISMDSGPYGEAARLEAARDGTPIQVDVIEDLNRRAQSLIVQASGLASGATPVQIQIFSERYAELHAVLEEVEERVRRARSLVDLAGDAVMGTCG